ncbi:MAG: SusC/RagA family TonB-linked outer membrane protein [Gemmatimonas sp.]|nr:SusC/RagA family TonB-linked outer membrane protein [Gemmatimonas sp.]
MKKLLSIVAVAVSIAGLPALLAAQTTGSISGQVVDDLTNEPLANVQVLVVGTNLGTLTDVQGGYSLTNVPAGAVEVRAARLGYSTGTQTVTVTVTDGAAAADFRLTTSAVALDEVVVTGTPGAIARRENSAVVASVDASSIVESAAVNSFSDLLTARVPGMSVTASSGSTGTAQHIRIRGASSISLSNEPLIFIDGVLADSRLQSNGSSGGLDIGGQGQSRLADINPADIESIEVVKGPAAATLYGADASAGVIQIITKRGRLGTNQFVQNLSLEYNDIDPNFEPLTAYFECSPDAVAIEATDSTLAGLCSGLAVGDIVSDNALARSNVLRNGNLRSLAYSARGGGDNYGYYVSLGLDYEDGTLPNNGMDRQTGRLNFNFTPNAEISVDAGLGLTSNHVDLPNNDNNIFGYLGVAYLGSPGATRIQPDGTRIGGTYSDRPFEAVAAIESVSEVFRATPTLSVNYMPTSWFTNRLTLGADVTRGHAWQYFPINSLNWYTGETNTGDLQEVRANNDVFTLDYLGSIEGDLSQSVTSKLSFGAQLLSETLDRLTGNGVGFVTAANRVVGDATQISAAQSYSDTKRLGLLGHWDLGYNDRLYLQFGARIDQNSSFGANAEAFFLPKVGASYVISEEPFWEGLAGAIPEFRVRAAWGQSGRSPDPGASLETYAARPYAIYAVDNSGTGSGAGVVPDNPGNFDLKPERGTEFEVGFDAGFLNDRLGLEVTYFNTVATDVLLRRPVPPSTGAGEDPWVNIGETRNSGIEYALRGTILNTPTTHWEARISGLSIDNEVVDLGDVEPFGTVARVEEGHSIGYLSTRLIREVITEAGDPRCQDLDECVIVSNNNEFFGHSQPTYEGNFSTTLTLFNNLAFTGQLDWKGGHRIYNDTYQFRERSFGTAEIAVKGTDVASQEEVLRRYGPFYSEEGDPVPFSNVNDAYYEQADFIRLREVAATYQLPTEFMGRLRASSASITVGARNLALFTDYSGADPEVLSQASEFAAGSNSFVREDFFTMPLPRRYVVKMNVSF